MTKDETSFCFPVPDCKVDILFEFFEKAGKSHLLGIICELGAAIPNEAKYILQCKDDTSAFYWFATIDFLESSKDGVFVRLNHPLNKDHSKLPEFDDVFKMIDGDEFIRRNRGR